jgi:hypothetical protein
MQKRRSLQAITADAQQAFATGGLEAALPFVFEGLEEWGRREDAYHRAFETAQREQKSARLDGRAPPPFLVGGLTQRHGVRTNN